jgi:hypothetical protein
MFPSVSFVCSSEIKTRTDDGIGLSRQPLRGPAGGSVTNINQKRGISKASSRRRSSSQ